MRRLKLGILQTNHDKTVEVGDAFPDDAHRFRDLFDEQDQRFAYRVYMTIGGEVPADLDEQDAFMITGSPLSVLDRHIFTDELMSFIRRCDAAKKPLMGACFGHQAIAVALGGQVERSTEGYNIGIEETAFQATHPYMAPQHDTLPLYMFHEDQVTQLPEGCKLLGSTKRCRIAGFTKGRHILTTQAHPEFSSAFMEAVLRYTEDKIPEDATRRAWATMEGKSAGESKGAGESKTAGKIFGDWSTRFFQQGMTDA